MRQAAVLGILLALSCAPVPRSPVAPVLQQPDDTTVRGLTPDAPFRAGPPAPEAGRPWLPPHLRVTTLPNGMRLIVVERHATQLVAAHLIVRGGAAGFPSEAPAVVTMATDVAFHGSATRNERNVFETMNTLFADAGTFATDDAIVARLRATSASFDAGLVLIRDVTVEPAFAPHVVDFERQRRVALLPRDADDPSRVALRLLYASAYGAGHPYARARLSGGDVLPNVARDDLVRAWKHSVDPADATLVVAGDVDPAALAVRVESLFGTWKHDPSRSPPVDVPPPSPGVARLVVVDRPGAPQATIAYGMTTASAAAPAHIANAVVSEMLGGMPSSTLAQTLRDRLGATALGAGVFAWRRGPGLSYWQGSVDRDRAADVLRTLDARVRELHERGPAAGELDDAKERFARALPDGFETVGGIVETLAQIPTFGLPLDEFDTREARARAVKVSDVRAVVPAPEAMKAVVVGDLPSLRAQLTALGWGVIEERDVGGALVRTFTH